jgi:hypothetical protein
MAKAKKAKPTAKKKAAPKPAVKAAASEAAKPSEVTKLPSEKTVKDVAKVLLENAAQIEDLGGDSSGVVREAKKKGLHPAAFKDALKTLKRVKNDPKTGSVYLSHRDYYEETLGVNKLIADQPELPIDDGGSKPAPETVKAVAQKATPSTQPTVELEGGTVLRPNFTQPEAEQHLREAKQLN